MSVSQILSRGNEVIISYTGPEKDLIIFRIGSALFKLSKEDALSIARLLNLYAEGFDFPSPCPTPDDKFSAFDS